MRKTKDTTDFSVLCPASLRGYKKQQKNLLGYFMYRYSGYSRQRAENNDWYYMSNTDMLKATGIASKTTLYVYIRQFIADGVIEMQTGDRTHANLYRLTEPYRDSRFNYVPPVEGENLRPKCTTLENTQSVLPKCTTQQTEIEETGRKSVLPIENRAKCTVDTDTDTDTEKEKSSVMGVYTLTEGTNIAPDPENDFDTFDFLADATDTGEADTYTYTNDETEQYAYQMAQDTMNNTPTETTATPTPTPKPNKKRYWESWKAFKVAMPTLPKDKAKEHFDTYYTKLGVLYTGDELAKHRQGITDDYERIMNKANNNNSNYTNGSKFQLPDDMRIDIMPLRAMGYTNREILATYSQMAGENIRLADELPNRKNYVPQYVRYYFNEMRQIIAPMISDGYTDADLTDIAKSYFDSVLERYQPENFK